MKKISDVDLKILAGLLRNSKESDRQLAKAIGVSQPTVTRRRARLEKEAISSYTLIPKWVKLGFKLLVITFTKSKEARSSPEKLKETLEESREWMIAQPNVIVCVGSRGMDMGGFMISLHRDYSEFDQFMRDHNLTLGKYLDDVQNVIVNLDGGSVLKPFDFAYLADYITGKP
ncbi:MAG: Lrp/AsnC family transcriptional regulator [Candidatus Bathyarchaeota archaeon]|nr:MAG: Lrp/AsnC family transcriptional regulator [Candidatus Bathyarchaeota archaeon]